MNNEWKHPIDEAFSVCEPKSLSEAGREALADSFRSDFRKLHDGARKRQRRAPDDIADRVIKAGEHVAAILREFDAEEE